MCGRYAITMPAKAMAALFDFVDRPDFPDRFNIAPTQPVPIVRLEQGQRRFHLVRWGLIPSWSREPPASLLINARAETIHEKPSFRGAFRHHRCLMPASGFYEWRNTGSKGKQPFFIRRRDGAPFAMASIYDQWMGPDGSEIDSCAVVTTAANTTLRTIHQRMPVILAPDDWANWLDPAMRERDLLALLHPAPDDLLEAIPVSARVNRIANDDPGLMEPVAPAQPGTENPGEPAQAKNKSGQGQMDLF